MKKQIKRQNTISGKRPEKHIIKHKNYTILVLQKRQKSWRTWPTNFIKTARVILRRIIRQNTARLSTFGQQKKRTSRIYAQGMKQNLFLRITAQLAVRKEIIERR